MNGPSDNPLWLFSLKVYGNPDVEPACLRLQENAGADVNLVLFCCWLGLADYGQVAAPQLRDLLIATSRWHEKSIGPLRALRRDLKGNFDPVSSNLGEATRQKVLAAELEAERALQGVLFESVQHLAGNDKTDQQRGEDALANVTTYFQLADIAEDEAVRQDVLAIVRASIPGRSATP